MNLVWKLLRHHISIPQLTGFFFANLVGMLIVLLGFQFYRDVLPVFTSDDSFMKADFLIVSKRVNMGSTLSGRDNNFTPDDLQELENQPFVSHIGRFTSSEYRVDAAMGINGQPLIKTELFFESVPDEFVDTPKDDWSYQSGSQVVPVILPRTYLNMYNFGFAQARSLPKISDGLAGMIDLQITIHGNGRSDTYKGRVVGFSNRLNTILVPQTFMDWSNQTYAPEQRSNPSRIVVEVANPADERIMTFFEEKGYEVETDKLNAEKTTYFLRMIVTIVMIIGLIISVLSFYILMLSIFLLVQKNSEKLQNLLLIGYSPARVARPYQTLTIVLNMAVALIAWVVVALVRGYYMDIVETIFPQIDPGSLWPSAVLALILLTVVSLLNILVIRHQINRISGKR